uniref:Uncharacterized protein n=1 Tax=Strigamia maritima TaxID=126957 RepID=T1ITL9_STRMM
MSKKLIFDEKFAPFLLFPQELTLINRFNLYARPFYFPMQFV